MLTAGRHYAVRMLDAIFLRRSIRSGFEDREVTPDVVDRIVASGLCAPSSKDAQPWRIHIVTDIGTLTELADAVQDAKHAASYVPIDPATGRARHWQSTVAESASVLRSVPLALFVENTGRFSDGRHTVARADDSVRASALVGYSFEMIGLGAAVQNMWLAAVSLGLVGVFMGDVLIAEDEIRSRLGMRGDLVGVLALGYGSPESFPKQVAEDRVVHHGQIARQPR